jgi:hypothetical protein
MSHTIELPDAVYDSLLRAAQAEGVTPAEWIGRKATEGSVEEDSNSTAESLYDVLQQEGLIGTLIPKEPRPPDSPDPFGEYLEQKHREGRL